MHLPCETSTEGNCFLLGGVALEEFTGLRKKQQQMHVRGCDSASLCLA